MSRRTAYVSQSDVAASALVQNIPQCRQLSASGETIWRHVSTHPAATHRRHPASASNVTVAASLTSDEASTPGAAPASSTGIVTPPQATRANREATKPRRMEIMGQGYARAPHAARGEV